LNKNIIIKLTDDQFNELGVHSCISVFYFLYPVLDEESQ